MNNDNNIITEMSINDVETKKKKKKQKKEKKKKKKKNSKQSSKELLETTALLPLPQPPPILLPPEHSNESSIQVHICLSTETPTIISSDKFGDINHTTNTISNTTATATTTTTTTTTATATATATTTNNICSQQQSKRNSIIPTLHVTKQERKQRMRRIERFGNTKDWNGTTSGIPTLTSTTTTDITGSTDDTPEMNGGITTSCILGTNMVIEKSYLRLTSYPKQELVRPLSILIQALYHVKHIYQDTENFDYCHDQLKSIRQDLTVQQSYYYQQQSDVPHGTCSNNINEYNKNNTNYNRLVYTLMVLDTYQTHARILLEHGQLNEFNQCLSNVLQIYDNTNNYDIIYKNNEQNDTLPIIPLIVSNDNDSKNDPNTTNSISSSSSNIIQNYCNQRRAQIVAAQGEFRAYNILYTLVQSKATFLDLNMILLHRQQQQQQIKLQHVNDDNLLSSLKHQFHYNDRKRKKRRRVSLLSSLTVPSSATTNISTEERHAWDVVHTMYTGAYHSFFHLYNTAPHMSGYLIDYLLHRIRVHAYTCSMASYRPTISCAVLQKILHFDTKEETIQFLEQRRAVFIHTKSSEEDNTDNNNNNSNSNNANCDDILIDCRQSQLQLLEKG